MIRAIFIACVLLGTSAQAEPFITQKQSGQYQVVQRIMDRAMRTCLRQSGGEEARISGCVDGVLARCNSERPSFAQDRTRELHCLWGVKAAWDEVLRVTTLRAVNVLSAQDAAEAGKRSSRPLRNPTFAPAQAAWEAYREAECTLTSSRFRREFFAEVLSERCWIDKTVARVVELRAYGP